MRPPGKGRKKTELKKIEKKSALMVSFSKRRSGLFRKINRMAEADGFDFAMVVFSPGNRAYTTGNTALIDEYCRQNRALEYGEVAGALPVPENGAIVPYNPSAAAAAAAPFAVLPAPLAERSALVPYIPAAAALASEPAPPAPAARAEVSEEDLLEYMRCLRELQKRVEDRSDFVRGKETAPAKLKKYKNVTEVYLQDPIAQD